MCHRNHGSTNSVGAAADLLSALKSLSDLGQMLFRPDKSRKVDFQKSQNSTFEKFGREDRNFARGEVGDQKGASRRTPTIGIGRANEKL